MTAPAIAFSHVGVALKPAPIRSEWVIAGTPVARNAEISRGTAATAPTFVWECTAGTFDWVYDADETILVIEGSVLLRQGDGPVRRVSAGDVVFFPRGSCARWEVEDHVRKLAFFTPVLPKPVERLVWLLRRAKRLVRGGTAARGWTGMATEPDAT